MENLSIIQNNAFSTSIVSPIDSSTLYTIASRQLPTGAWVEVLYRVERDAKAGTARRSTELATVSYIDAATTRVRFRGGVQEVELDLDAFLRRRKAYSNSRIFVGPDDVTYKWRINGEKLELFDTTTKNLIACSHPHPTSKFSLRSPFTHHPNHTQIHHSKSTTHHPTLSLDLALLNPNSNSALQMLDAIVLTFLIMQRQLRERLAFSYRS